MPTFISKAPFLIPSILGSSLFVSACAFENGDGSSGETGGSGAGGSNSGGVGSGAAAAGGMETGGSGGGLVGGRGSGVGGETSTGGVPTGGMPATGGEESVGGTAAGTGGSAGGGSGGESFSSDRSSEEFLAELGLGWNLGNSLDAPEGETAWGNPVVTPELFAAVADAGFELVRIPVTWSLHTGPAPDYTIEQAWLERVAEVVDDALAADLAVIINLHHDGADDYEGVEWLTLNDADGNVTEENNQAVEERFVRVWTQIANHFAGYPEELLFESMNEIHDGYDEPDPAYYGIINNLNQVFVDLVRQSGGNNSERHLVVPGYNTNIDYTLAGFELPTDSAKSRLILSVHYYDPWDFAGAANTNVWGADVEGSDDWGQEDHVVEQFDKLEATYVDAGIPVIVGEYGAVHQEGFEDYRRYYMEYVTKASVERGITPVYWDNGSEESGEEAFGLISRDTGEPLHPEILDAMIRALANDFALDDIAPPSP